jgi:hypothetical protein
MCIICRDNQVQDVDRNLLAGATLSSLNQKYGFSLSVLQRHKKHLFEKVGRAQTRLRDHLRQSCLFKLNRVLEIAMHTARAVTGEGNVKTAIQGAREVTRIIDLMTKQDFELDPEMVYCLLHSPAWVGYHGLLPTDSEVIPKIRQTMAENLATPCPEPESSQDRDPRPTSTRGPKHSELATPLPRDATPKTVYRKRPTGNAKREMRWEKGGKMPGKTAPAKKIKVKYQEDTMLTKDAENNAAASCPGALLPEVPPVPQYSDPAPTAPLETRGSKFKTFCQKLRRKWQRNGKMPG